MTTLPQTTPLRLPRPASTTQLTIPGPMLPAGMVSPVGMAPQMTGGDVWRVLRANIWLIILLLIASAVAGYVINSWLERNHSSYTAQAYVQVQTPQNLDPAHANQPIVTDLGLLNIQLKTEAQLMTDPQLFSSVLTNDNTDVHNSTWYRSFFPNMQLAKEDLKKNFHVSPVLESRLLSVSMTANDAKSSQTMLKAMVDEYIKFERQRNSNTKFDQTNQLHNAETFYLNNRDRVGAKIAELQNDLSKDGVNGNGRINIKELELTQLTQEASKIDIEQASAMQELENIRAAINANQDPPKVTQAIAADPEVLAARSALNEIELRIDNDRPNFDENSQVMKELNQRRVTQEKKLADATSDARVRWRNSLLADATQRAEQMGRMKESTTASIKKIQQDMGDIQDRQAELTLKQNEFAGYESKLKAVQDQLDQNAQYAQKQDFSTVDWVRQPEVPEIRSFPKLTVTMSLAIGVGLILSLGIAFLREFMDTSIRSPRDISRVGNMNLLGMVPHEDDDPQSAGARLPVVIFEAPHSMMAEQLRQVRTRLQHSSSLDSNRSILVTSPSPGDGKSTIACNLASGLALNGRRILLVDANFRRPELHRVFNLGNEQGFSDVLNSLDLFEHAVQETQVPNLYILPSGPKPTNATELLESQLLLDFIERSLEEFDHVIFDSGPLLFVSETVALAPRVDGVVTVVRARTNSRGVLTRMRDTLRQVKAEHLGVVLNAVRAQGGGYYGRNIRTYYEYQNGEGRPA